MESTDKPRQCGGCQWWNEVTAGVSGICTVWGAGAAPGGGQLVRSAWAPPFPQALLTPPDFGCISHEVKTDDLEGEG